MLELSTNELYHVDSAFGLAARAHTEKSSGWDLFKSKWDFISFIFNYNSL